MTNFIDNFFKIGFASIVEINDKINALFEQLQ